VGPGTSVWLFLRDHFVGGPGTEHSAGAQELEEEEVVLLLLSAWLEAARLSGAQATASLTSAREVSLRPKEETRDPDIADQVVQGYRLGAGL